ncbi:unnamed protein product [Sphagnum troendelagicum]
MADVLLSAAAAAEVPLIEVPASHLRTHQLLLLVRSSLVTSGGRLLISCLFCFKLSCKNFYQASMLYAASDVAPHLVKVLDVRLNIDQDPKIRYLLAVGSEETWNWTV